MSNSIEAIKKELTESLHKIVVLYTESLKTLRTGVASFHLLDHVHVEVYGEHLPLNQVATLSIPEPQRIMIEPWDKSNAAHIEKALLKSSIHMTVQVDGGTVYAHIPPLTEEHRKELVKELKHEAEKAKVSARNVRRDTNEHIKVLQKEKLLSEDDEKHHLDEVQKLVTKCIDQIDELTHNKEQSLLKA